MKKVFGNVKYWFLLILACCFSGFCLTSLLRIYAEKNSIISSYAYIYTMLAVTIYTVNELYDIEDFVIAMSIISVPLDIAVFFLILEGAPWNWLISIWLLSVLVVIIPLILAARFINSLKETLDYFERNLIYLITALVLNSMAIFALLITKFPIAQCFFICAKDLMYKCSYSSIVALSLLAISYLVKQGKRMILKLSKGDQ